MKKLLLAALLCLTLTSAQALTPTVTPTAAPQETPAPAQTAEAVETPAPTRVPDMIAVPEGEKRPLATRTPRPTDAPLPEDPFMANAVEIARRIDLLAESSLFIVYWDGSGTSLSQRKAISRGDHTNPVAAYEMTGESMLAALTAHMSAQISAQPDLPQPDLSRPEIRRDLVTALPDMLLADLPEDELDLIRTLWRYKVFADDRPDGCGLMFLLYEDATPVAITWYTERGAVNMSACFMPDEALEACRNAQEVAAWFSGKGLPAVAFEEVTWR